MVEKFLRIVVAAGAIIFGLLLLVYAVVLAINWNDRPPSEIAEELEASYRDRAHVDEADNGYVYMLGFSVGVAQDPSYWGKERIAWARRLYNRPRAAPGDAYPGEDYEYKAARSPSVEALSRACQTADAACFDALSNEQGVSEWLATEAWLLERYRTLIGHPAWFEAVPFDARAPFPPYLQVLEGQRLLFVRAWQLAGQGNASAVRTLLEEDVRFWREVLADADILVTKMVATSALRRHFAGANLVLQRFPPDGVMAGVPELWKEPISDQERSLLRCLTGEWKFATTTLEQAKERDTNALATFGDETIPQRLLWTLLKPTLQRQDFSNRYAALVTSLAATLDVPYMQFPAAVQRAKRIEQQAANGTPSGKIYNPIGDLTFSSRGEEFSTYAAAVADLEGVRRIALLSAQLRQQGLHPQQVASKLSDAVNPGPYGKPLRWDASEQAIVFTGLLPGERGRYTMPLM